MKFIHRRTNKHLFVIDPRGFIYKFKRLYGERTTWLCNSKKCCKGTLIQFDRFFRGNTPHIGACTPNINKSEDVEFRMHVKKLCVEKRRSMTNSQIYNESMALYPRAKFLLRNSFYEFAPTIVRWKEPFGHTQPKTITELDLLLHQRE